MSILRRLWPRRRAAASITMGVHVVVVPKPIPVTERKPGPEDRDSYGQCWWWGTNHTHRPAWVYSAGWGTHWLPASVEVLPARCCAPEVE